MADFGFMAGTRAAIAVSGGGDSVALMLLFAQWAGERGVPAAAVLIVDHALRQGSGKEAALVAQWAGAAGFTPHVLRWKGAKPRANIEDRARDARYRLMGEWCRAHRVGALFVAHTEDDQAETVLLRLGRGSGVDGLSAMRPRAPFPLAGFEDVELYRPLLGIARAELRAFLNRRKASWLEDPMNADPRFARVRLRKLLPALEEAGVPARRIAGAASHLARAREALEWGTRAFLERHARSDRAGPALLDAKALGLVPREIGLRALSHVLMAVSGADYRPRFERLERLFDTLIAGNFAAARTLLGCRIGRAPKARAEFGPATLLIAREGPRKGMAPEGGLDRARRGAGSAKTKSVPSEAKLP